MTKRQINTMLNHDADDTLGKKVAQKDILDYLEEKYGAKSLVTQRTIQRWIKDLGIICIQPQPSRNSDIRYHKEDILRLEKSKRDNLLKKRYNELQRDQIKKVSGADLEEFQHVKLQHEWLQANMILYVESGSYAYGTNTEKSDKDFKGIAIPPLREYYLGSDTFNSTQITTGNQTSKNSHEDIDVTIYSIKNFVKMAEQANPNIIEMLYVDNSSILFNTPYAKSIIENRHLFLTNRIANSFGGFAFQCRKRIERDILKNNTYDTKDLMHSIRLYETATQAFETGIFNTKRENAEFLLSVRNGLFDNEQAIDILDQKKKSFDLAFENSILPNKPNHKKIQELLINLSMDFFNIEISD